MTKTVKALAMNRSLWVMCIMRTSQKRAIRPNDSMFAPS
jgi:hypothetical protein